MNTQTLSEAMGQLEEKYITEAITYQAGAPSSRLKHRLPAVLIAAILAILLMGAGIAVASHGDFWLQNPSDDPVKVVRTALENQMGKAYTVKLQIHSVAIDEEETCRVAERFLSGAIADWRGWSDEYLSEHFTVVKAVYYAEYDHTQTTRSDGDVTMYFYLTQDVDSGEWSIIDNSGNVNQSEPKLTEEESRGAATSIEEQLFSCLSDQFNQAFAPYYDGLHYAIDGYTEVIEGSSVTATFLWTMYHLGTGWDVETDKGVESEVNIWLQGTAALREDGSMDTETLSVLADSSAVGPPDYSTPVEAFFPTQPSDAP